MIALSHAQAQAALDDSPFGPWWGFTVDHIGPGTATVSLPARPELFRPGGVLQGGCCMTLADVAFWVAIMTVGGADEAAVTLEMKTTFLRGARSTLRSTAEVLSPGRRIIYGQAFTKDGDERLVSHHTLTYVRPT